MRPDAVGRWEGGGTHTGPALSDFLVGSLSSGFQPKDAVHGYDSAPVVNGKIAEAIGVTALQQLGILKAAWPVRRTQPATAWVSPRD
jgi:hypothetical protein